MRDTDLNERPEPALPARPPKVLITKIGLDGHDRGSRLVAGFLRDAGMEVVYTGPWQPIDHVVELALEEDVELIGLSSLATDHMLVPGLIEALRAAELGHVPVIVGGIVPDEDEALLAEAGVARIYHPGATKSEIVGSIRSLVEAVRGTAETPAALAG